VTKAIRNIAILGSTGSIGTQTLEVVRAHPDRFKVKVLTAGSNIERLIEQAIEFKPAHVVIARTDLYPQLRDALAPHGISVAAGAEALAETCERPDVDTVVTATVGYSGLIPTVHAIRSSKRIALANKETLVVAGELITSMSEFDRSLIMPVDSEHSAIYQCLVGEDPANVSRLIITASGGPFRNTPASALATVKAADALRHPNWMMGRKITVDSATMINKAFEIIEARWLFDVTPDRITAVVHPQSIVHSMVEFRDGAVKAQLGLPDMRLPIGYALGIADRMELPGRMMSLADMATLTFEAPDSTKFPCLRFARLALDEGGNRACVINAANEIAVEAFLSDRISFPAIHDIIAETLIRVPQNPVTAISDLVAANNEARHVAAGLASSKYAI